MASRAEQGRPPGIHDVARLAGVSTATVSRALRGLDRVSPATRARVLAAAEQLHYAASPSAASLVTGRTGVVAVLAPYLSRWFFAHVLDAVERTLRRSGLHVLLITVGDGPRDRELLHDRQLLHRRVDGLLVLSCDLRADEVDLLQRLQVPVVTVGVDVGPWHLVGIDDAAAGETAMTHLLELGHSHLAYVGGDTDEDVHVATAVDRGAGVRRALRRARLPVGGLRAVVGDWTVEGGRRKGHDLLDDPERPTAVLAASDEMAVGVLWAARELGLRVPEDVSVIGIDDHEFSATHGLTTVAQPVEEIGETAAGLLVEELRGGTREGRRTVVLPTRLVVRGTTAPPQGSSRATRSGGSTSDSSSRARAALARSSSGRA